jgi:DNA-binding MarR family transcriptional regulator
MNHLLIQSTDTIGMFCRTYMHIKRDIPIRSSEMGVLIYISKETGLVTPLSISKFFRITKPSVTSLVTSLLKQDYLIKLPSELDKRSYTLCLSIKGKHLVESTFSEYSNTVALLEEKMGDLKFMQMIELMNLANQILGSRVK